MATLRNIAFTTCTLVGLGVGGILTTQARAENFKERCNAPGVVRCVSFDDDSQILGHWGSASGIVPGSGAKPMIDTAIKASGNGSLRFTIPGNSGNVAGAYFTNFSDDLWTQFGEGEEFYVQWRQRISPEFLSTNFDQEGTGGWRQAVIGEGDRAGICKPLAPTSATCPLACTQIDIVAHSRGAGPNLPALSHSCAGKDGRVDPLEFRERAQESITLQNAVGCKHDSRFPDSSCVSYKANQWMTWQIRVKVGAWYKNDGNYRRDSTVQMWVAEEGQASKLVVDFSPGVHGYDLANNNPSASKYGKIWLLPFQPGKSASVAHTTAHTWYDELIISREKIADPSPTKLHSTSATIGASAAPAKSTAVPGGPANISSTTTSGANTAAAAAFPPTISLLPIKTGLELPIGVTNAKDGSNRLFLNLQRGSIVIWDGTQIRPTPFLDIGNLVSCCGEQGLLGVAFHPQYATNGFFYVNYTDKATPRSNTIVARYKVSATDPNRADPTSARILLTQEQPFSNHNGGQIRFGPDGYLYISMGDGGASGDPGNRAQDPETLLGKMLRIDVDRTDLGKNYAIPPTNPYVSANPFPGKTPRKEIWSYGLRNVWAFSFDRQTGDLYMGDVGQNAWEEIDFQPASSAGGENYGWRLMEGAACFNPSTNCNNGSLTLPILTYDHGLGCSVTGGYVYRGSQFSSLVETYLYGDVCSGRIWGAMRTGSTWTSSQLLDTTLSIVSWGEDEVGELYLTNRGGEGTSNGGLYRVMSTPSGEIIVDNAAVGIADANRTFVGAWCRSVGTGQFGSDSLYSCGGGRDTYRWTPNIVNTGYFDVYVRWSTAPNRSAGVPFVVTHADGATSKTFNQTTGGGQWVLHGTYRFLTGASGNVEVNDSAGIASADAIRLVPAAGPARATLRVGVAGDGSGRVRSVPAGIDCGADCNEDFAINTVVNLTATPDPGSTFFEWGGPCAGNGACSITMNDSKFLAATFVSAGLVVDNAPTGVQDAAGGRTFTGTWCRSVGTQFYGTGSVYSCGPGTDTYRWTPTVPTTGTYDVYIRWSVHPNRSPDVPVTIVHAAGSEVKSFNQTINGGKWVLVGRYNFNAGSAGYVQMAEPGNRIAAADAIQLVRVP